MMIYYGILCYMGNNGWLVVTIIVKARLLDYHYFPYAKLRFNYGWLI